MDRRTNIKWAAIALGVVSAVVVVWLIFFNAYTIRLTEAEIQAKVGAALPKTVHEVTVESVTVKLHGNDVHLDFTVSGKKYTIPFSVKANAVGQPQYDPSRGTFFFKPSAVKLDEVMVNNGKPPSDAIAGAAKRYIPNSTGMQNLALDIGKKLDDELPIVVEKITMGVLTRTPVYTLPNDVKGIAAQAVLDRVAVEDGKLVIDLTLRRLTWWVILFAFALLISVGMLGAMARNPGLFTAATIVDGLVS